MNFWILLALLVAFAAAITFLDELLARLVSRYYWQGREDATLAHRQQLRGTRQRVAGPVDSTGLK